LIIETLPSTVEDEMLADPLPSDLGFSVKLAAYTGAELAETGGDGTI